MAKRQVVPFQLSLFIWIGECASRKSQTIAIEFLPVLAMFNYVYAQVLEALLAIHHVAPLDILRFLTIGDQDEPFPETILGLLRCAQSLIGIILGDHIIPCR